MIVAYIFLQAGIEDKQLTLALEPEAAAIYCKQIAIQRFEKDDKTILSAFEPGTKFLLLDLGGMRYLALFSETSVTAGWNDDAVKLSAGQGRDASFICKFMVGLGSGML